MMTFSTEVKKLDSHLSKISLLFILLSFHSLILTSTAFSFENPLLISPLETDLFKSVEKDLWHEGIHPQKEKAKTKESTQNELPLELRVVIDR